MATRDDYIQEPRLRELDELATDASARTALPMQASKPEHFWQSTWAFVLGFVMDRRMLLGVKERAEGSS